MSATDTLTIVTEAIAYVIGISFDATDPPSVSLADDLGTDSLEIVEIVMEIEDRLRISIPDEEAANLETVGDLVRLIDQYR